MIKILLHIFFISALGLYQPSNLGLRLIRSTRAEIRAGIKKTRVIIYIYQLPLILTCLITLSISRHVPLSGHDDVALFE